MRRAEGTEPTLSVNSTQFLSCIKRYDLRLNHAYYLLFLSPAAICAGALGGSLARLLSHPVDELCSDSAAKLN